MSVKKLFVILFSVSLSAHAAQPTAASMTAKALELLQKNQKQKALKLLEVAFTKTKNKEERTDIGILILEASPLTYAKRESYLRTLVKLSPEDKDSGKWMKELGDKSFDK